MSGNQQNCSATTISTTSHSQLQANFSPLNDSSQLVVFYLLLESETVCFHYIYKIKFLLE